MMTDRDLKYIGQRIGSAAARLNPEYAPTPGQSATAAALLRDWLQAAESHGITWSHLDAIADFPRMAIQLVQDRDAR